jgi:hypothetical protein
LLRGRVQRCNECVFTERLEQALDRTLLDESQAHRIVPSRGNEDNWDRLPALCQFLLQLRPGHSRHRDVENQTFGVGDAIGREEVLCGRKRARLVT